MLQNNKEVLKICVDQMSLTLWLSEKKLMHNLQLSCACVPGDDGSQPSVGDTTQLSAIVDDQRSARLSVQPS